MDISGTPDLTPTEPELGGTWIEISAVPILLIIELGPEEVVSITVASPATLPTGPLVIDAGAGAGASAGATGTLTGAGLKGGFEGLGLGEVVGVGFGAGALGEDAELGALGEGGDATGAADTATVVKIFGLENVVELPNSTRYFLGPSPTSSQPYPEVPEPEVLSQS
jgi:hypothetical protein